MPMVLDGNGRLGVYSYSPWIIEPWDANETEPIMYNYGIYKLCIGKDSYGLGWCLSESDIGNIDAATYYSFEKGWYTNCRKCVDFCNPMIGGIDVKWETMYTQFHGNWGEAYLMSDSDCENRRSPQIYRPFAPPEPGPNPVIPQPGSANDDFHDPTNGGLQPWEQWGSYPSNT